MSIDMGQLTAKVRLSADDAFPKIDVTSFELGRVIGSLEARLTAVEKAVERQRAEVRELRGKARSGFDAAAIDERIELALGRLRVESIDSYRNGFDRVPEPSQVVPDLVDGAGVRRRADPSANLGDEVGQLTHDLAPSVGPEGSVGGSSASTIPSGTDVGEPSGERS